MINLDNPWVLCAIGVVFCISALIMFFKSVFEERRSIRWSIFIMLMGIVLIGIGTAKFFGLTM